MKKIESPDRFCWLSSPVAEATDGGLRCFIGACWSSTTRKEVGCPQDCCCCHLLATWLGWAGWMTRLEGGSGYCGWWPHSSALLWMLLRSFTVSFLMSGNLSPIIAPSPKLISCRRLYGLLSPAFARGMTTAWFSSVWTGPWPAGWPKSALKLRGACDLLRL